jgi:hypothetical protein
MFEQVRTLRTWSTDGRQNTPTSQSAANALTRLRDAFAARPLDESAIKGVVCSYVDEMKKVGATAERVIVDIKRAAEAAFDPSLSVGMRGPATPSEESLVLNRAVSWCIEHYFWTDKA